MNLIGGILLVLAVVAIIVAVVVIYQWRKVVKMGKRVDQAEDRVESILSKQEDRWD